jgi:undecaprenyl-diphosphatase
MRRKIKKSVNWVNDSVKLLSIELAIVLIAFVCSVILLIFLIKQVFLDKAFALDDKIFVIFNGYVSDATTSFFRFFTLIGSQYFLIPANLLLMAYAFFVMKDKWFGIKVTSVAFSSLFLMLALKLLFNRPRPSIPLLGQVPGLNSFPSGHTFMSFTFFGLLIYTINKKIRNKWIRFSLIITCLLFVIIIGLSRIYLRVHYASDVMAGLALGLMWLVISLTVINYIERKKNVTPFAPGKIVAQKKTTPRK